MVGGILRYYGVALVIGLLLTMVVAFKTGFIIRSGFGVILEGTGFQVGFFRS